MASVDMVLYCFDTLHSHLYGGDPPQPTFDVHQEFPLFVTWHLENGSSDEDIELRGCIGTLSPTKLLNLKDYTIKSALKDRRFHPIGPDEFHKLHCSVSLLVDYEQAEHYEDWEIGIHGVIIELQDDKGEYYSATYLPDVASEQGWTHLETIKSLVKKAGFRKAVTSVILQALRVTRYRSSKHKLTCREYLALKHQNRSQ